MQYVRRLSIITALSSLAFATEADQLIQDDLIVNQSLCTGVGCADMEDFGLDTLRIKNDNPKISFQDTSVTAAFPTIDWAMGFTSTDAVSNPYFYIQDVDGRRNILHLETGDNGAIAIGAGATPVAGAVSVGSEATPRKVVFVAPATDETDAVTLGQFQAFTNGFDAVVQQDQEALDQEIVLIQQKTDELTLRLNNIISQLEALQQ